MTVTDSFEPDYTGCPAEIASILVVGNFVVVSDYTVNDGDAPTVPTGDAWAIAYHNDGIEPIQAYVVYDFDLADVILCHNVTVSTTEVISVGDKILYWLPTWKFAALGEYQGTDANGMRIINTANTLIRIDNATGYRYWPLSGNEALVTLEIESWTADQKVGLLP